MLKRESYLFVLRAFFLILQERIMMLVRLVEDKNIYK